MKLRNLVRLLLTILTSLTIIFAALFLGPSIEAHYKPVLTDITVDSVYYDGSKIIMMGTFNKKRECTLHTITASINDASVKIDALDINWLRPQPLPLGPYSYGPWVVDAGHMKSSRLVISTSHICHGFYKSQSNLLDIDLSKVTRKVS